MMTFESGVIGKLGIVGVVGKVLRKVMGAAFLMGKDGERGAGRWRTTNWEVRHFLI